LLLQMKEAPAEGADGLNSRHALNIQVVSADASHLKDQRRLCITYEDLRCSVQVKDKALKKMVTKDILKGLTGIIKPARLTAVMGASGAGKTTMLNLLVSCQCLQQPQQSIAATQCHYP
jgi:ABC-type transport system involved in cytochrome bd biosynthesis fused ATPase/permease subunit